jgi:hypothetical protein
VRPVLQLIQLGLEETVGVDKGRNKATSSPLEPFRTAPETDSMAASRKGQVRAGSFGAHQMARQYEKARGRERDDAVAGGCVRQAYGHPQEPDVQDDLGSTEGGVVVVVAIVDCTRKVGGRKGSAGRPDCEDLL